MAFDGRFSVENNSPNFEALELAKAFIELDRDLEVRYGNMQLALTPDTLLITQPTTTTFLAGDMQPDMEYQWVGLGIQGLTDATVDLEIYEFSNGGTYRCIMSTANYPDLSLRRNDVIITTDFSSAVQETEPLVVRMYPNPATDFLKVELLEKDGQASYQFVARDGRLVLNGILGES